MRRFFNFHGHSDHGKDHIHEKNETDAPFSKSLLRDLYCYRKQRGVNLGSWFVLERWISETPFRFAAEPGQSDLDVARGSNAKEVLENHWDSWITEDDFKWLSEIGINTVRIPIGYYHLCGVDTSVIQGTDFREYGMVFEGAWSRVIKAVETAQRYQIGVLIDLHAAPGKQNKDAHSGTSAPKPAFFNASNFHVMIRTLQVLVTQLGVLRSRQSFPLDNIVGVELLNEPQPPSHDALRAWYVTAMKDLRSLDPFLPIYIADCWRTEEYTEFICSLPSSPAITALDHHLYRCFTASDISTPASGHTASLSDLNAPIPRMFSQVTERLESAGSGLVIGEWSGALNPGSLHSALDEPQERARYVQAQLSLYDRYCAGWFFWTYKKEHSNDLGWSFKDAVKGNVLPNHFGLQAIRSFRTDRSGQNERKNIPKQDALGQHSSYWAQYPGHYEHWRFEQGFSQGWDDGYLFLDSDFSNADTICEVGFTGSLAKRRVEGHIRETGSNRNVWEFEHGLRQGVIAAKADFRQVYC
ncbi:glycoside hydrolase family 5 protein [Hygrophoropsis aurantiaca]|uniref:Glycoside hydrolase family 5 protein n=1 Tax=Hygrophoropsis aurantiaca TaxID=72124 RepID=A0ACB8A758_9AGAM|nr:glycoside hydrolase family 5 protein [Hygrophoropsis aurantiaca]